MSKVPPETPPYSSGIISKCTPRESLSYISLSISVGHSFFSSSSRIRSKGMRLFAYSLRLSSIRLREIVSMLAIKSSLYFHRFAAGQVAFYFGGYFLRESLVFQAFRVYKNVLGRAADGGLELVARAAVIRSHVGGDGTAADAEPGQGFRSQAGGLQRDLGGVLKRRLHLHLALGVVLGDLQRFHEAVVGSGVFRHAALQRGLMPAQALQEGAQRRALGLFQFLAAEGDADGHLAEGAAHPATSEE